MSRRQDTVESFPSRAWSCNTLVEGVQRAAELAGLDLAATVQAKGFDLGQAGPLKQIFNF